jgi:hypothetical protein
VYGLGCALRAAGFEVEFLVTEEAAPDDSSPDFPVRYLAAGPMALPDPSRGVAASLVAAAPDVVWCFRSQVWPVFSASRGAFPHVLYSLDPPWETESLRQAWRDPGPGVVRKIVSKLRTRREVRGLLGLERRSFREAAGRGVVAVYSAAEADGMRARTGIDVAVCPLAYPDWGLRAPRPAQAPPRALLLGNMESVHTRYGLRYFFDRVWPEWRSHPERPRSEVRVVGGGHLPPAFDRPAEGDGLRWVGFVPSLEEEWSLATCMLVPVPLVQGVRSRIAEAWSRGVPVVAHPAAEVGLPMMRAGSNYLAARTAGEWMEAVKTLERHPDRGAGLAREGRAAFLRHLWAQAVADRFRDVSEQAMERMAGSVARG